MQYPDVKNSKEEEDHWIGLSDFERERFERRADFLIDQGYVAVDPLTLAIRIAWKMRSSPQPQGLVYEHSLSSFACGHDRRLSPFQSIRCIIYGRLGRKSQRRAATTRFRTIQVYPKDTRGHLWAHSVHRSARGFESGPKGGRS
jgi:hypothetical protein